MTCYEVESLKLDKRVVDEVEPLRPYIQRAVMTTLVVGLLH